MQLFQRYLIDNCGFPEDFDVKEISRYEITDFLADLLSKPEITARNRKLYSDRSFLNICRKTKL